MEAEKDILTRAGRDTGMRVPDGYFADFAARMESQIPMNVTPATVQPRTFWQQIRPYAYLAAMFAGIWCMIKMFSLMGTSASGGNFAQDPVMLAALDNDQFVMDYVAPAADDYEIYDELYTAGFDVESLSDDDSAQ